MRTLPDLGDLPDVAQLADSARQKVDANTWRDISVTVVTPIYGGGVEAGQLDAATPISPKAIRGHLRYWWRLMTAPSYNNADTEQALREIEIFGAAGEPSPLEVLVRNVPRDFKVRHFGDPPPRKRKGCYGFKRHSPESYALFPPIQDEDGSEPDLAREGLTFDLMLSWPSESALNEHRDVVNKKRRRLGRSPLPVTVKDLAGDVDLAVKAWLNIGGIGARTRRGLGAVWSSDERWHLDASWRRAACQDLAVFQKGDYGQDLAGALGAWRSSVGPYHKFRQQQSEDKGRSQWPEANTIRCWSNCPHPNPDLPEEKQAFPRAVLGMPIQFVFKNSPENDDEPQPGYEPCKSLLTPEASKRMASPVITRPMFLDGQWRAGIAILPHDHVQTLTAFLTGQMLNEAGKPSELTRSVEHKKIVDASLRTLSPMQDCASAIDAFVKWLQLREQGFTKWNPPA